MLISQFIVKCAAGSSLAWFTTDSRRNGWRSPEFLMITEGLYNVTLHNGSEWLWLTVFNGSVMIDGCWWFWLMVPNGYHWVSWLLMIATDVSWQLVPGRWYTPCATPSEWLCMSGAQSIVAFGVHTFDSMDWVKLIVVLWYFYGIFLRCKVFIDVDSLVFLGMDYGFAINEPSLTMVIARNHH